MKHNVTIFQAGRQVISTGYDLEHAVERAKLFGYDVSYESIDFTNSENNLIDGKIYYKLEREQ